MSIRYRRLGGADAPAFQRLRVEGAERHPREFRFDPADERAVPLADVAARLDREHVIGAIDDDTLVGIAGLAHFAGAKLTHKGLVWGMYVRVESRGAGIGRELLAMLLDVARASGIGHLLLTVVADNAGARRLYERAGFVVYGVEPRAVRVGEAYLDEALMMCQLEGSA